MKQQTKETIKGTLMVISICTAFVFLTWITS